MHLVRFKLLIDYCGRLIFSLWDQQDGSHKAELVSKGEGVEVSRFGGEGTGYHALKEVDWHPNENIVVQVHANWIEYWQSWLVECQMSVRGKVHNLATFRRGGQKLHDHFGFNSFIEDWYQHGGCLYQRSAAFSC